MLDHQESIQTPLAPSLPPSWYYSEEQYKAEKENIFKKDWVFLCHTGQIPERLNYITCDIAGIPVAVLRDEQDQIQVLLNICRHRGALLLTEKSGKLAKPMLMCQYHGWCYHTDGGFKQAPFMSANSELLSLKKVNWVEVNGMIFVNFSAEPQSFAARKMQMLQEMDAGGFRAEKYQYHSQITRTGWFNWKTWVEGFQECYHCPTIHTGFNKDFHLSQYKVHNKDHFSVHTCPRKVKSATGSFEGLWMWIFPNCGLPCYEKVYYSLRVNPKSPTQTELIYTFFTNELFTTEDENTFFEFIRKITDEDIAICEQVQKNIEEGTGADLYEHGYLNLDRENGVHYFHELVRMKSACV
jgi:phenylpropionate dioxygenase-like ring-hydroxylating dioxygenase large terminal subunit